MHPEIFQLAITEGGVFPFKEILRQLRDAQPDSEQRKGQAINAALALANKGNISAAIELVSSVDNPEPPLKMLSALLHLWNSDHDRFIKEVQASLEKKEPAIPLWKRLGDIGSWLKEDWAANDPLHSWPPQLIEEVYLAALAEFDKEFAARKRTFKELFLKLLTQFVPSKFDFIPLGYDRVRILRLLASNANEARHFYSAIRYAEQARSEAATLLTGRQAEFAYSLSEFARVANFCGIMGRDYPVSKRAREASMKAKRIADAIGFLKPHSYRYGSIIHTFIMVWFESARAFSLDMPYDTMIGHLEAVLSDLQVVDSYTAKLQDAVTVDLAIIRQEHARENDLRDRPSPSKTG